MKPATAPLVVLLAAISCAAQIPTSGTPAAISPEKRALIKELYNAIRAGETAEKITSSMLDHFADRLPFMLGPVLEDSPGLKGKNNEELQRSLAESSRRVLARIKELMPQRVNWAETLEEIAYPIYDKHFTEQELRDLVAFYKTPTGQKSIQVMPDVFKEAMQKASELLGPAMTKLMTDVLDEEKERLRKK